MGLPNKLTPYHWLLFATCFLGTVFAGVVSTLMSVYLPVAVRDLLGDTSAAELNNISAYINAVFIFGGAIGGFIAGFISDRAGRKWGVILSIAMYGVFTMLTGFMPSWPGVVIARFFTGFGLGGVLVATTTLMMEEWPERSRAVFIGILSIGIPVGIFSAGVVDYFVSSWRNGFLVGTIPLALSIVSIWLLRESAQWKAQRLAGGDRRHQNENIFATAHLRALVTGSVIFGAMLIGMWAIFSWIPTWIQGLVTVGDAQKERGISMMMLGMGGLTGGFVSGWLTNAIGLRRSMLLCFAVSTILSFIMFRTNSEFSPVIYAEIGVMAFFFGVSQGVLSVYIPGLFPVNIRGTATGFCFNTGRIVTATAVLFVGLLVTELGGYANSLFVFSFVFVVGLGVTFFTREKADSGLVAPKGQLPLVTSD